MEIWNGQHKKTFLKVLTPQPPTANTDILTSRTKEVVVDDLEFKIARLAQKKHLSQLTALKKEMTIFTPKNWLKIHLFIIYV